jgi:hypothetical protein
VPEELVRKLAALSAIGVGRGRLSLAAGVSPSSVQRAARGVPLRTTTIMALMRTNPVPAPTMPVSGAASARIYDQLIEEGFDPSTIGRLFKLRRPVERPAEMVCLRRARQFRALAALYLDEPAQN